MNKSHRPMEKSNIVGFNGTARTGCGRSMVIAQHDLDGLWINDLNKAQRSMDLFHEWYRNLWW